MKSYRFPGGEASRHLPSQCLVFALAVPMLNFAALLQAQPQTQPVPDADQVLMIGASDGSNHSGRLAVNAASGNENQQLASAVVAIGDAAITGQTVTQLGLSGAPDQSSAVIISGNAFSGNSGIVSLNLTAGSQNQSANLASLAIGQSGALSDQLLEQSRAPTEPSVSLEATASARNDTVAISDSAFGNGSGVFQANVIGGERNSSANTFSLIASAGGKP